MNRRGGLFVTVKQKPNPVKNALPESFSEFLDGKGFVLSLKRHIWRGNHAMELLKHAGFTNLEIFDAVDGMFDKTDYEKQLGLTIHPDVYAGARGATISMILMYKKIIDENLPYAFIFEDDALPHPDLKTVGDAWYSRSNKNTDFLFLGSQFQPSKFPNEHVIQTASFCLHAYCITNKGARKALELLAISSKQIRDGRREFPGVDVLDCEIIYWMSKHLISWQNWNMEGLLSYPYSIIDPPDYEKVSLDKDCIRSGRHGGLIWQNLRCGSCIHEPNIVYAW